MEYSTLERQLSEIPAKFGKHYALTGGARVLMSMSSEDGSVKGEMVERNIKRYGLPKDIDLVFSDPRRPIEKIFPEDDVFEYLIVKSSSDSNVTFLPFIRTAVEGGHEYDVEVTSLDELLFDKIAVDFNGHTLYLTSLPANLALYGLNPSKLVERPDRVARTLAQVLKETDDTKPLDFIAESLGKGEETTKKYLDKTMDRVLYDYKGRKYIRIAEDQCERYSREGIKPVFYIDYLYPLDAGKKAKNYVSNNKGKILRMVDDNMAYIKLADKCKRTKEVFDEYAESLGKISDYTAQRREDIVKKLGSVIPFDKTGKAELLDCGGMY